MNGNHHRPSQVAALPDLLTFSDGKPVESANWPHRRTELFDSIIPHEFGGMPPTGDNTTATRLSSYLIKPDRTVTFETYEVRVTLPSGEVSFIMELWIPEGDGPFPVLLTGDGCWRFFNDNAAADAVKRGYIAAAFNRASVAADNKERYRDTGIYRAVPDPTFGAVAAWAWGYHRCVDVLRELDVVQGDQIAITGHSRGGKTALLAGATDERIAITNPNCSGTGGSGLNRLKEPRSEVINDFIKSGNIFWFGDQWKQFQGRDAELPYDQHFLHALVAPRGLLVTEAYGDFWANPPGSYAACYAAKTVYDLLDFPMAIGWEFREGEHDQSRSDFEKILDFMDFHFRGRDVARDFQRQLFPTL
ncbi:MAG: hypothetical protein HN368_09080 [Spirochaetales bacterium]|jgi:hypothetical protein|nr:hypothetical protein [Spirochaetales bacterium]